MRSLFLILTLYIFVIGCKKDETPTPDNGAVCGSKNPTQEIAWLKNEINAVSTSSTYADYYAKRAIYKGREILWIEVCCPVCNTVPPTARYCNGSVAGMMGTDIAASELSGITEIWRTHNGLCGN